MQTAREDTIIAGDYCLIPLRRTAYAIIDKDDLSRINKHNWFLKKSKTTSYAARKYTINGLTRYVLMHRVITDCPKDKVVHHINHNSLDNRKCNLVVVTPKEHNQPEFRL